MADLGINFDLGDDLLFLTEDEPSEPVAPPKKPTPNAPRPAQKTRTTGAGRGTLGGRGRGRGRGNRVAALKKETKQTRRLSARSQAMLGGADGHSNDIAKQLPDLLEKLRYFEDLVPTLREKNNSLENLTESLYSQITNLEKECQDLRTQVSTMEKQVGEANAAAASASARKSPVASPRGTGSSSPRGADVATDHKSWFTKNRGPRRGSFSDGEVVPPITLRSSSRVKLGGRKNKPALDDRGRAFEKLLDGHRTYINELRSVVSLFMEPLRSAMGADGAPLLSISELNALFGNADVLLSFHALLQADLTSRWSSWTPDSQIGDVLLRYMPMLRLYIPYCSRAISTDVDLNTPNALGIREVINQGELQDGIKLISLLRIPTMQVDALCEYLEKIESCTEKTHHDLSNLTLALSQCRNIAQEIKMTLRSVGGGAQRSGSNPPNRVELKQEHSQTSPRGSGRPSISPRRTTAREDSNAGGGLSGMRRTGGGTMTLKKRFKNLGSKKKGDNSDSADFIKQKIMADICAAEANPDLTPAERGRLKLQRAYAEQGKFEAALAVMVGPGGSQRPKAAPQEASIENMTFADALELLMSPACDAAFRRTFLTTFTYFTTWKLMLSHFRKLYKSGDERITLLKVVQEWLEVNPQLKLIDQTENATKKPSKQSRPAHLRHKREPSAAPQIVHRKTKKVTVVKRVPRELPESDVQILDKVGDVLAAVAALRGSASAKNDAECVKGAKQGTTETVALVKMTGGQSEQVKSSVQAMRQKIVALTQATIAMIKGQFADEKIAAVEEAARLIEALGQEVLLLIRGEDEEIQEEIEVSYEEEENLGQELELFFDEDSNEADDEDAMMHGLLNPEENEEMNQQGNQMFLEAKQLSGKAAGGLKAVKDLSSSMSTIEGISPRTSMASDNFVTQMDGFIDEMDAQGQPEKDLVTFYVKWKTQMTLDDSHNSSHSSAQAARAKLVGFGTGEYLHRDFVTQVHPREVAAQFCVYESAMFRSIPRGELFNNAFMDADKAPNFNCMVAQFNTWTQWVYTMVLHENYTAEDRRRMISYMITIGSESLKMNNYNAAYAFVAGLNHPGISRLKKSWALVSPKFLELYKELMAFWNTSKNYKIYRQALKGSAPPAIPYLGLIAKDLFHLEDASETILENEVINFNKLHVMRNAVSFIETLQKYQYDVVEDSDLLAQVLQCELMPDEDAMALSLRYEPREASN